MKNIILYYSLTGNTRKVAMRRAQELGEGAELYELKYARRMNKLRAFFGGCFDAMRHQPARLQPLTVNLNDYDIITIAVPIWAGHPAPPLNTIRNQLVANLGANATNDVQRPVRVELIFTSNSAEAEWALLECRDIMAKRGIEVVGMYTLRARDIAKGIINFQPFTDNSQPAEQATEPVAEPVSPIQSPENRPKS